MKFGLFFEAQSPRPWGPDTDRQVLEHGLAELELADRLGFDYVFVTEHHGLEEHSHMSAPEVFLGALSQRTKQIRLGTGICHAIHMFNHPLRTAERMATLDLLSGGRLEFGTGESNTTVELGSFGVPPAEKRAMWEESLEVILRLMAETPFAGHNGRYIQMPPVNMVPKPLQAPHPPLWMAGVRREAAIAAARKGMGVLGYGFVSPDEAAMRVRQYYDAFARECVPFGYRVNPNYATLLPLMCHEDEEYALAQGMENYLYFSYTTSHYYIHGQHRPGKTNIWEEFQANRDQIGLGREIDPKNKLRESFEKLMGSLRGAIGTPQQIREVLRAYERAGVDMVLFQAQAGRSRHEDVCASLELFACEVMPEFKARDGRIQSLKQERLAPVVARLEATRRPVAFPDVDAVIPPPTTYQHVLVNANLG